MGWSHSCGQSQEKPIKYSALYNSRQFLIKSPNLSDNISELELNSTGAKGAWHPAAEVLDSNVWHPRILAILLHKVVLHPCLLKFYFGTKSIFQRNFFQEDRGILALTYPIANGIIKDFEKMEKIWDHSFVNILRQVIRR